MKLEMWTGDNVLIIYYMIFLLSWPENCGCYGNENSQNVTSEVDLCVATTYVLPLKKSLRDELQAM